MADKSLQDYILGIRKEHNFTIRIAISEISDKDVDRIENNLKTYELLKVSKPKKTIHQSWPLGFAEPMNSEVVIINVTTGMPASSFYIGREVAKILGITENKVVVNGADNPTKNYKLDKDGNYDHAELYGDDYNTNMLKTIEKSRKDK